MISKFWKSSGASSMKIWGGAIATVVVLALSPLGCTASKPSAQASAPAESAMMKKAPGAFVSVEHKTMGNVSIVTEGTQRYLVLSKDFQTSAGPDLFVILHQASPPKGYGKNTYVSLAKLQNVTGEQRYAIPADVDLKSYKSAVIWCRQFSATFAYAPLP
jgi:Electron transfer DM13